MGLLAGGKIEDLEDDEDEEIEDEDEGDEAASNGASTSARVRALIEEGATSKAELVAAIGRDASHRIDTALSTLRRQGVIRATGRGSFERVGRPARANVAKPNGGGKRRASPPARVKDVSCAPAGRFIVRIAGAEVDCSTAADVVALVRELGRR